MMQTLMRLLRVFFLDQVLLGLPAELQAFKVIHRQIDEKAKQFAEGADDTRELAAASDLRTARRYYEAENERRTAIEEKAKTNFQSITLAFSIIFAALTFLRSDAMRHGLTGAWEAATLVLTLVGVMFLIVGGLEALRAIQVGKVYRPTHEDEARDSEFEFLQRLIVAAQQNQLLTTLRTNALDVSYKAIRNGTLTLAALIALLAVRLFATPPSEPKTHDTRILYQGGGPSACLPSMPRDTVAQHRPRVDTTTPAKRNASAVHRNWCRVDRTKVGDST